MARACHCAGDSREGCEGRGGLCPGPRPPARRRSGCPAWSGPSRATLRCQPAPRSPQLSIFALSGRPEAERLCHQTRGVLCLSAGAVGMVALAEQACFTVTARACVTAVDVPCAPSVRPGWPERAFSSSSVQTVGLPWSRPHAPGDQSPPAGMSASARGVPVPGCMVGERWRLSPGATAGFHPPLSFHEAREQEGVWAGPPAPPASLAPGETA